MKRVLLALALVFVAGAAFAIDTARQPHRIGILRAVVDSGDAYVEEAVVRQLLGELQRRGFDAFDTNLELVELDGDDIPHADYFVEIAGSGSDAGDFGGIGIGTRNADIELSLLVSRVVAEVRVYDGTSLELVSTQKLSRTKTAVVPTALGFGGRSFFAAIALPIAERAQFRSCTKAAAREAATKVAAAIRPQ